MRRPFFVALAAVAAAMAVSLPTATLAKSKHVRHTTRVYVQTDGYGYSRPYFSRGYHVYSAGTYVGSDPDPNVRGQMLSDFNRGVTGVPGGR